MAFVKDTEKGRIGMKLGITMEGGASRTVFSCGVADALLEENIMPDYFIGVSAGIAYGVSYLSQQKGRNLAIVQKYMKDKRYMGVRHLLRERNFYNIPFVFGEIPNKLEAFDYEAFAAFPGKVEACVTNIHTGKPEYLEVPRHDDNFDVLVASCALPVLFQPVKLGKHYYLDGGLSDSVPYQHAIEEGCDKNIVILTRERGYVKKTEHAGKISMRLYRKYPKIVEAIKTRPEKYNACIQELMEREEAGEIFVIAPENIHGVTRTESDPEMLTKLYEEGYQQAKKQMDALKKYLAEDRPQSWKEDKEQPLKKEKKQPLEKEQPWKEDKEQPLEGRKEQPWKEEKEQLLEGRKERQDRQKRIKIVFLDAKSIGDDIDLSGYEALGEVIKYDFSTPEEASQRVADADVVILNKVPVNAQSIGTAKNLKLVCVTATGTDNLDKDYLGKRGIAWRNVAGYSTESVAQHTFSLLFYLAEHLPYYDDYVKSGRYVKDRLFTHFDCKFSEIHGKTWGIIGMGAIGRRVAEIAALFGCKVIYYSTTGQNNQPAYQRVSFGQLLEESDIVSVHAPLTAATKGLMDRAAFARMKKSAIFLNLGRGPIVVEQDLADALNQGEILAAGLDVLCAEPMSADNPLRQVQDPDRLLITPHIAWASLEARKRMMGIILGQIEEFFS